MAIEFRTEDWERYRMDYRDPHRSLEPLEQEIAVVSQCLSALRDAGILEHVDYDETKFRAFRTAVAKQFEIPWTAITPRMQRLIYAINAIHQPTRLIAAGIFCGNTFISNAGAAIGPGAVHAARRLVGVEIKPEDSARAERNVRQLDHASLAEIIAADAIDVVRDFADPIDLLYLDADGTPEKGKGIYLDILQAGYDRLPDSALVLAHNSINAADRLEHYLAFVRDPANFRASVNCKIDGEGLEVSCR